MEPPGGRDSRFNLGYSMNLLSGETPPEIYGNPNLGRPSTSLQQLSPRHTMVSSACNRGIKSDMYDDRGMSSQGMGLDSCVNDINEDTYSMQSKKSPPSNGKKTKGRVKIKMEYIENKLRRYTTFSKRKTGIMKKAYELSTLTGTQVMLLVASETGHVYTFATRKLQPMITSEAGKALIQTCLNSPDPPAGSAGGDQRMSATGFEETELTYNISDDDSKNGTNPNGPKAEWEVSQQFSWNEREQGYILGSFFWLHWTTQIPGGILASKYGTKLVFGLSNLMGILACLGIPWFAKMGAGYLIFIRALQGLLSGFAWPSMHNLTAKWIPPNERSRFVTAYLGSSVGAGITYPLCGLIIDRWGWEVVFYVCGGLGLAWFVSWWCLVYDTPSDHPRLSKGEREYILQSLGQSVAKKQAPVPWKCILTDVSVWMNVLSQVGACWGLFTLITNGPTFFKFIHGWNIRATGVLSGMPHMFRMLWAYVVSLLGDNLLRTNKMKRTTVRKLANLCCCGIQGIFVLGLSFSGCDKITAVILFTLAIIANGAVSTGALASIVDMSPNYASVILGLVNTAVAIVGFCTPAVVGYLTFQNQTIEQWQKVYWIAAVFLFTSAITFTLFAKSELKPWNSLETENVEPEAQGMMKKKMKETNDKFIENIMYSKEEVY